MPATLAPHARPHARTDGLGRAPDLASPSPSAYPARRGREEKKKRFAPRLSLELQCIGTTLFPGGACGFSPPAYWRAPRAARPTRGRARKPGAPPRPETATVVRV